MPENLKILALMQQNARLDLINMWYIDISTALFCSSQNSILKQQNNPESKAKRYEEKQENQQDMIH